MYINLLVTGRSQSGKTVAVCNTYRQMTKKGLIGEKVKFGLVAQGDTAGGDNIRLKDMYVSMLKHEKMPAGTAETIFYDFAFQRDMKTICDIHWMDYRGALTDDNREDPAYRKDWEDFRENSNHMALLVYIIPGKTIDTYIRTKEAVLSDEERELLELEVDTEINQIKTLMEEAKRNWEEETNKDDTRPILFYVTKSDLIKYDDNRKLKELVSMLVEYGLLNGNRKILGCHSTLGRNLILSEDNRILDGFKPEGFEIPLMLTVGYAFSEQGKKWERDESARLDALIANEEVEKDIAYEKKVKESNRFLNKLKFWQKENKRITEFNNQINSNNNNIQELRNEKANLESKNILSQYSQEILDYIKKVGTFAIYVDEKGDEKPLEEFFR